jgi:hypothetical protein
VNFKVIKNMKLQQKFNNAVSNNDINTVKSLINHKEVLPENDYDKALFIASQKGYTEIVKVLISNPRVNHSSSFNQAIRTSLFFSAIRNM